MNRFEIWPVVLICACAGACSSDEDEPAPQKKSLISSGGAAGSANTGGTGGKGGSGGSSGGTSGRSGSTGGNGAGGTAGASNTGGSNTGGSTGGSGAGRGGSGGSTAGGTTGSGGSGNASGTGAGGNGGTGGGGTSGGGTGGDGMEAGSGGDAGGTGTPSDGCAGGTKPARGHYTITVGSTERGFFLSPASSDEPVPLIFEFHGAGGVGEGIISGFGLETSLGGHAVLIAPDGVDQGGTVGWGNGNASPDIELVKALIEKAKEDHCVDTSRIYALGFSWGGWMASQTACALGPELRAFVSVAGGGPMGGSCGGPVAGMIVHGSNDGSEPIASGMGTRDKYKTLNGCSGDLGSSPIVGCQAYPGCTEPLLWCQHDGDHYIPQFVIDGLPAFFSSLP